MNQKMNLKMNPEVKELFLAALRSDEFEQGTDCLEKDGKYCCLGLLSELGVRAGVAEKKVVPGKATDFGSAGNMDEMLLPKAIQEWSGFNTRNPYLTLADGTQRYLAVLNDSGVTFPEIAELVEKHL